MESLKILGRLERDVESQESFEITNEERFESPATKNLNFGANLVRQDALPEANDVGANEDDDDDLELINRNEYPPSPRVQLELQSEEELVDNVPGKKFISTEFILRFLGNSK